jgi:hypothetical protein
MLIHCRNQDIIDVNVYFKISIKIWNTRVQRACNCLDKFTNLNILVLPFKHVKQVFMLQDQIGSHPVLND